MPQRPIRAGGEDLQTPIIILPHRGTREAASCGCAQRSPVAPGSIRRDLPNVPERCGRVCAKGLIDSLDRDEDLETSIIIFPHERMVNGGIAAGWTARREPGAPGSSSSGLPDMHEGVVRSCSKDFQAPIIVLNNNWAAFEHQASGRMP